MADARKVKNVAPLACKTDKVDARVLAELCRRDLVPALWIPSLEERALRERLKRRLHLVRLRTSAKNRVFGLLTQWGLRIPLDRLRQADAMELLDGRGMPEVSRRSVAEALAVIDLLDERIAPLDASWGRWRAPTAVVLLDTIPGIGSVLGLTIAAEIGDVARFAAAQADRLCRSRSARQAVGRALAHGELSKADSRTLRFAAVEAAQGAWRETNPWHRLYTDVKARTGKANPAKAAVARKVLIACWHVPQPPRALQAEPPRAAPILSRQAPPAFWPPDGPHAN